MHTKALLLSLALAGTALAAPDIINHQGRIAVANVNHEGPGYFKFALVDDGATETFWTNDGTNTGTPGSEPTAAITLTVTKGHYALGLGDTTLANMTAVPPAVFADEDDVFLRTWFSTDNSTFHLLTPDRRLASAAYALNAEKADGVADGSITSAMLAAGSVSSDKLADGAVTSTQLAAGAVQANNLADSAVEVNHLAVNAVTSSAIADGAITANKLSNGYSNGPDVLAGINFTSTPDFATFAATFPEPFAPGITPTVSLPAGWSLDPGEPSETGFTAKASFMPVVLDPINNNGAYSSIALVDGRPAIAYADISADNLKYIIANDAAATNWAAPIVVDAPGNVGVHCHLGVVQGRPAIAYRDVSNATLKYAIADDASGANWTTVTIDSAAAIFPTIRQVNGRPAIAYLDTAGDLAKYAYASTADGVNPTDWTAVTIAATTDSHGAELNIVDGHPAMAYLDVASNQLQYVRANDADGSSWPTPIPINPASGPGSNGEFSSMAIIAGHPAVAYQDNSNNDAYFVRADDATGATWGAPVLVSSEAAHGNHNSLTVIGGRPALAYVDQAGARGVIVTVANDPEGTSWGARVFVKNGNLSYTSLLDLGGRAAISFYDNNLDKLTFAHLPPFPEWTATGGTVFPIIAANAVTATTATTATSADSVADDSITTTSIADGTITAADIAPEALGSWESLWTENAGHIYRSSGNVGIGRSNPDADLMVGFSNVGSGLTDALAVYGVGDNTVGLQTVLDGRNLTGYGDYGGVNNRMILQPLAGLVGIGVANPLEKLHVDGNIRCTSVVITSDRNKKDGFEEVNPREVLNKLASMEISKWHYKSETDVTHIGPMAQDFHNAFGVGPDDKHINTVDADGIALAAIQGLKEVVDEKDAEIKELKSRLERLEQLINN